MEIPLATNYLAPNATFLLGVVVVTALTGLLVIWPLVDSVRRRQWGYVLGIVLLGPFGGLVWLTVGRRETRPPTTA